MAKLAAAAGKVPRNLTVPAHTASYLLQYIIGVLFLGKFRRELEPYLILKEGTLWNKKPLYVFCRRKPVIQLHEIEGNPAKDAVQEQFLLISPLGIKQGGLIVVKCLKLHYLGKSSKKWRLALHNFLHRLHVGTAEDELQA